MLTSIFIVPAPLAPSPRTGITFFEGFRMTTVHRLLCAGLLATAVLTAASPQKGTEIPWDKYGVAHVYAKSVEDLFYGYGFGQAQSHGNLLLRRF